MAPRASRARRPTVPGIVKRPTAPGIVNPTKRSRRRQPDARAKRVDLDDIIENGSCIIVDTIEKLQKLLTRLTAVDMSQVCYLDIFAMKPFEGGRCSALVMHFAPAPWNASSSRHHLYLVDVHRLGHVAFHTTLAGIPTATLRGFLESSALFAAFDPFKIKVALAQQFNIQMTNFIDIQLMEHIIRYKGDGIILPPSNFNYLFMRDAAAARLTQSSIRSWMAATQQGPSTLDTLVEPESLFGLFRRPMNPDWVKFCIKDVLWLPMFHRYYQAGLQTRLAREAGRVFGEPVQVQAPQEPHPSQSLPPPQGGTHVDPKIFNTLDDPELLDTQFGLQLFEPQMDPELPESQMGRELPGPQFDPGLLDEFDLELLGLQFDLGLDLQLDPVVLGGPINQALIEDQVNAQLPEPHTYSEPFEHQFGLGPELLEPLIDPQLLDPPIDPKLPELRINCKPEPQTNPKPLEPQIDQQLSKTPIDEELLAQLLKEEIMRLD